MKAKYIILTTDQMMMMILKMKFQVSID